MEPRARKGPAEGLGCNGSCSAASVTRSNLKGQDRDLSMVDNVLCSLWETSLKVGSKATSSVAELLTTQKAAAIVLLGCGTGLEPHHGTSSVCGTGAACHELTDRPTESRGQAGRQSSNPVEVAPSGPGPTGARGSSQVHGQVVQTPGPMPPLHWYCPSAHTYGLLVGGSL